MFKQGKCFVSARLGQLSLFNSEFSKAGSKAFSKKVHKGQVKVRNSSENLQKEMVFLVEYVCVYARAQKKEQKMLPFDWAFLVVQL